MEDEDYDFDQTYGFAAESPEALPEYGIFERSAMERAKTVAQIASEAGVDVPTRMKRGEYLRDPVQRFYVYVDVAARNFIRDGFVASIGYDDVRRILETIRRVKNAGYKNAVAFVLGYCVGRRGRIDRDELDSLLPKLSELDPPLKSTDLLRYSRLWVDLTV